MIRWHVIRAVFRRNFVAYFTSPTGYVFITVFILLSAAVAFMLDSFFGLTGFFPRNLANLDTLNALFPYMLIFFIPTITMGTWAEERHHGTDELLLTLPARDTELVVGKYLSALGIYSVALFFSLDFILVLVSLGRPDIGVMLGTYAGYWFLGATLIAVGMVGSLLTSSMTVAFILGAIFSALPILLGNANVLLSGRAEEWVRSLSILDPFREFASGIVSLRTLVYFAALAGLMIYLNLILLARRHMAGGAGSGRSWLHFGIRAAAVLVAGVSLTVLAGRYGTRVDLTQERLHSLTRETREIIWKIDPAQPVLINAFVSPEVPKEYVETRESLLALLREYAAVGHERIQLRVVDTKRYSPEAREADQTFGIKPQEVRSDEGRGAAVGLFLGVSLSCRGQETTIPFMHKGLSIEYELTRALGVVAGAARKRIGIVATDVKLLGGWDFDSMSPAPGWQIVEELKRQYDVVEVSVNDPITDRFDALLAVMPSTLTQPQMNNLLAYVKKGGAVLLLDDPLPMFNLGLAPDTPKRGPGQGQFGQPAPEQKGDIRKFMAELGVTWPIEEVVWDSYNPHPRLDYLPKEVFFVGPGSGAADSFNPGEPISSGLQEMVFLFAGDLQARPGSSLTFSPLVRTTRQAGTLTTNDVFSRSFMGRRLNPHRVYVPTGHDYVLAARVTGTLPGTSDRISVVAVADVDFVSDQFFDLRKEGLEELNFDNVTFVLNCVDALAGDESYVAIRKRRPRHRTLEEVEHRTKEHRQRTLEDTKKAEDTAEQKRKEAQARFDGKIRELSERTDLKDYEKEIKLETLRQTENRRLEDERRQIDDEKAAAIERSNETLAQAVDTIQKRIKVATLATPLPPLVIGLIVLVLRLFGGRKSS